MTLNWRNQMKSSEQAQDRVMDYLAEALASGPKRLTSGAIGQATGLHQTRAAKALRELAEAGKITLTGARVKTIGLAKAYTVTLPLDHLAPHTIRCLLNDLPDVHPAVAVLRKTLSELYGE